MVCERYKEAVQAADGHDNMYDVQRFVTAIGGGEGAGFYRLPDGTPTSPKNDAPTL
jgi:hypothetical protein